GELPPARLPDEGRDQAGLPDARRPGHADHVRVARVREEQPDELARGRVAALDERDRACERACVARPHGLDQLGGRHAWLAAGARSTSRPRVNGTATAAAMTTVTAETR